MKDSRNCENTVPGVLLHNYMDCFVLCTFTILQSLYRFGCHIQCVYNSGNGLRNVQIVF